MYLAVSLALLLFSSYLTLTSTSSAARGHHHHHHAVLLHADKSAFAVSVYHWNETRQQIPLLEEIYYHETKQDIGDYLHHLTGIKQMISGLLELTLSYVPEPRIETEVFFRTTSGLRTHDEETVHLLMDRVEEVLSNSSIGYVIPYTFSGRAAFLSAEEDAAFTWLASNFRRELLDAVDGVKHDLTGIVDLDDYSLKIAFLPHGQILSSKFPLQIGPTRLELFATTYLFAGLKRAWQLHLDWIAAFDPDSMAANKLLEVLPVDRLDEWKTVTVLAQPENAMAHLSLPKTSVGWSGTTKTSVRWSVTTKTPVHWSDESSSKLTSITPHSAPTTTANVATYKPNVMDLLENVPLLVRYPCVRLGVRLRVARRLPLLPLNVVGTGNATECRLLIRTWLLEGGMSCASGDGNSDCRPSLGYLPEIGPHVAFTAYGRLAELVRTLGVDSPDGTFLPDSLIAAGKERCEGQDFGADALSLCFSSVYANVLLVDVLAFVPDSRQIHLQQSEPPPSWSLGFLLNEISSRSLGPDGSNNGYGRGKQPRGDDVDLCDCGQTSGNVAGTGSGLSITLLLLFCAFFL